jgi:hypothetical protein
MIPANLVTPARINYMLYLAGTTSSLVYSKILISSFFITIFIIEIRSRTPTTKVC